MRGWPGLPNPIDQLPSDAHDGPAGRVLAIVREKHVRFPGRLCTEVTRSHWRAARPRRLRPKQLPLGRPHPRTRMGSILVAPTPVALMAAIGP
jgi:hypothetical protein